jgi:diacylglycerol kinase family enzyme
MAGIGIVNNPAAQRNRRAPGTAARLAHLLGADGEVADASTEEELAPVVERFRARDIDLLGVNGGDGTCHVVLTALARAYGAAPLPPVALLRSGALNTLADVHKLHGSAEAILKALIERRRAGVPLRTVERDLLSVEVEGAPPRYGFLFGTGAVVSFLETYARAGHPGRPMAALLLLRGVASALVGGSFAARLTRREHLRVSADGEEWPEQPYVSVLAGTVPEIGFGFAALARCDEQPGFFHAVGVTGTALQMATHLPRTWLGRPWKRALAHDAVTRDLAVEHLERFVLDGDLYDAGRTVRLRTGPAVRLVVP